LGPFGRGTKSELGSSAGDESDAVAAFPNRRLAIFRADAFCRRGTIAALIDAYGAGEFKLAPVDEKFNERNYCVHGRAAMSS
jgi:hypothetical protein